MNYADIKHCDVANGPGVRVSLFVSGCTHHCKECFNPETWNFDAGKPFDDDAKKYLFEKLNKPYIQGITFSGGHPLEYKNILNVCNLIEEIKTNFPEKDIWLYTGYKLNIDNFTTFIKGFSEQNIHHNLVNCVLNLCDVVVDGPYIEEQRDITLAFCGSKNQRLIDVKKTIEQNQIVLYKL